MWSSDHPSLTRSSPVSLLKSTTLHPSQTGDTALSQEGRSSSRQSHDSSRRPKSRVYLLERLKGVRENRKRIQAAEQPQQQQIYSNPRAVSLLIIWRTQIVQPARRGYRPINISVGAKGNPWWVVFLLMLHESTRFTRLSKALHSTAISTCLILPWPVHHKVVHALAFP